MADYKLPVITGTGLTAGDLLRWSGSEWVNYPDSNYGANGFQTQGDVLDDLNTLGANAADSEFLVGTGVGALTWESGATVRTSIGLGTGDSPAFANLTIDSELIIVIGGKDAFVDAEHNPRIYSSSSDFEGWTVNLEYGHLIIQPRTSIGRKIIFAGSSDGINTEARMVIEGAGNVGIGLTEPKTLLTVEGTLTLKEQAAADADTEAYGQLWVKNTTPCGLWFTDDAGNDNQLTPRRVGNSKTINANTDALDVVDVNVVFVDSSGGNIVIGGFANGIENQEVICIKFDNGNTVTFEHNEADGTQKLYNSDSLDLVIGVGYGAVRYVCKNSIWYLVGGARP